jgi:hypothetical protein
MQWIRTLVEPVQGMVQRWLQTLANNKFDVVHRLGRNHGNARRFFSWKILTHF